MDRSRPEESQDASPPWIRLLRRRRRHDQDEVKDEVVAQCRLPDQLRPRERCFSGTSNDRDGRRDGGDRSSADPSSNDTSDSRSRPTGSSRPPRSWELAHRPQRSQRLRRAWQTFASCSPRRAQKRCICLDEPMVRVELSQRMRKPRRGSFTASPDIGHLSASDEFSAKGSIRSSRSVARRRSRLERVKRTD